MEFKDKIMLPCFKEVKYHQGYTKEFDIRYVML